jgi:signal transduction histidine kinase/ligand-binding sensor domain-containing protein
LIFLRVINIPFRGGGLLRGVESVAISMIILFIAALGIVSCTGAESKHNQSGAIPERLNIKGLVLDPETLSAPGVFIADNPLITRVQALRSRRGTVEAKLAGRPRLLHLKEPVVKIPGKDGVKHLITLTAITEEVLCGAPELITVRPPSLKDINPANFSSFNKLQGLRHDQVRGMQQDMEGNLWLATDDGLIRYDGKYFFRYSTAQGLNNDLILTVCTDLEGNIWSGSYIGGAAKYDGRYITKYTAEGGLAGDNINIIYCDRDGVIWIGTSTGLSRIDGKQVTNFTTAEGLCGNDIRSICNDREGKLWIGTYGGGLSIYDGTKFHSYTVDEGLMQNYISTIYQDRSGIIWIGTAGRGLMRFDGKEWLCYGKTEGFPSNSFSAVVEDNSGNLWFGTLDNGLAMFDGTLLTIFTEADGLSSNIIRCGISDSSGQLWFGTRGGGFMRYNGNLFRHLTSYEGLSNNRVMSLLEDSKGALWLGTFSGYVTRCTFSSNDVIARTDFSYLGAEEGLLGERVYSIEEDLKGNIWFATDGGGVSKYDGKNIETYTTETGLCSAYFRDIMLDNEGNLWFASYGYGVSKFDGEKFTNYSIPQGLCSGTLMCVFQDAAGDIWFGTADNGLCRFNGKTFIHYTPGQGFPGNTVYSIAQDHRGLIWIGTGGAGALIYDGDDFIRVSGTDDPNYNHILAIMEDSDRNIWLGTRFGPLVINSAQLDEFIKGSSSLSFGAYDFEDGFTGIGFNLQAIEETDKGTVWMGTTDRLTIYHREAEVSKTESPGLQITGIKLFNEDISWTSLYGKPETVLNLSNEVLVDNIRFNGIQKWSGQPENLSLRHDDNYVTISYSAISLTGNDKIRYQYKLDGLEDNWNALSGRNDISYVNLKHGKYIFRVKALNRFGSWSEEVTYPFTVRPPWWQTGWFYLFSALAVIALILGYIRLRVRKLKRDREILRARVEEQTSEIMEKNRELTRINAEKDKFFSIIAHDLRSPFGVFLGFTQQMAEELPNLPMEEATDLAGRMNASALTLFRLLENLLQWTRAKQGMLPFEPGELKVKDEVDDSIQILLDQAAKKKVTVVNEVPDDISMIADRNMFQTVIRNLVSNAVKYTAPGGRVSINAVRHADGKTLVSVKDTGIGMPASILGNLFNTYSEKKRKGTEGEPSTGLGLMLCREFIEKHNGKIWAESSEGQGSVFYFLI